MTAPALVVLAPQAFAPALDALARAYTAASGINVALRYGPAAGAAPQSISARLTRGEPADLVVLPLVLLAAHAAEGRVRRDSIRPLLRSGIAAAVPAGAAAPAIDTVDALRDALVQARCIAYSAAGSGDYVGGPLLAQLGIADQVLPSARRVADEPVARVLARREADLGFQQLCELLPEPGITVLGPLPPSLQRFTEVGLAVPCNAAGDARAAGLADHLAGREAAATLAQHGLEPPGA